MRQITKVSAVLLLSSIGCSPINEEFIGQAGSSSCSLLPKSVSKALSISSCEMSAAVSMGLPAISLTYSATSPIVQLKTTEICSSNKGVGSYELRCSLGFNIASQAEFAGIDDYRIDIIDDSRLLLLINVGNGSVETSASIAMGFGLGGPASGEVAVLAVNSPQSETKYGQTDVTEFNRQNGYFWRPGANRTRNLEAIFRVQMSCSGNGILKAPPVWNVKSISLTSLPKVPEECQQP